jgi:hypothetical protein
MKQMVEHGPDAGSYAPATILIDERPDGVPLSYDRMASFLATYGSPEALTSFCRETVEIVLFKPRIARHDENKPSK